ncbi:hypothetical protein [Amorphus sp. 3PC139-8]|uniref:hypothetical protein n=1 Tax=Amorphus sp. 3PC139-8 TaxID=2735676 RepID=UPI00345CE709
MRIGLTDSGYQLEVSGEDVDGMLWNLEEGAWAEPEEVADGLGPLIVPGAVVSFFGVCFGRKKDTFFTVITVERNAAGEVFADINRRRYSCDALEADRSSQVVMSVSNRPRCPVVELATSDRTSSVIHFRPGA